VGWGVNGYMVFEKGQTINEFSNLSKVASWEHYICGMLWYYYKHY